MAVLSTPRAAAKPVALPISKGLFWLLGAALLAVAVYYFIGVDQGATSVFGKSMVIHEFVHDARHFLGFPCHEPDRALPRHGKETHRPRHPGGRDRGPARVRLRPDL